MKSDPKMEKTAKTDKVAGISCQIYTWKAPDGDGEACLADKPGVDMGDFRKDATALGKKLAAMGVGRGATSVPLLQLADYGFPMKNKRTMSMGAQTIGDDHRDQGAEEPKGRRRQVHHPGRLPEEDLQGVDDGWRRRRRWPRPSLSSGPDYFPTTPATIAWTMASRARPLAHSTIRWISRGRM
jgi:hypothetical protein